MPDLRVIREMQIKATKMIFIPIQLTKMRMPDNPRDVDECCSLCVCFGNRNYFGKPLGAALPIQMFTHSPTWHFCL